MEQQIIWEDNFFNIDTNIEKVFYPLMKKNREFLLIWLWVQENKIIGKFALIWDTESKWWKELRPFEEYGVLKGIEYYVPHELEEKAQEYAYEEKDYYPYFNAFKLIINSKILDSNFKNTPTLTGKQARVPNSGIVEFKGEIKYAI